VSFPCKTCVHSGVCKNEESSSDFVVHIPKQATLPACFRIRFDCVNYAPGDKETR